MPMNKTNCGIWEYKLQELFSKSDNLNLNVASHLSKIGKLRILKHLTYDL